MIRTADIGEGPPAIVQRTLEARIARTDAEIDAAMALRYRVFYQEMAARPTAEMEARQRDFDEFDPVADHLLVIQREHGHEQVVGTYRLLRRAQAEKIGDFYSAREYDISAILAYRGPGQILELGRSCVDAQFRTGATMQLLWRAIAGYVFHYEIGLMFGCASLPGTDPRRLALPLSYLYFHHLAPPALRVRALPHRFVDMQLLPQSEIDARAALAELPPLIKGYLRLGGFVGDGAVIDEQFNTTDVAIIVKTDLVTEKYVRRYERDKRESEG